MRKTFILLSLAFAGCTTGVTMQSVDYSNLFHDGNSKVWMINKAILNDAIVSPSKMTDKNILVFHYNQNCDYIPLKDVTRKLPKKGFFGLNSNLRTLYIQFKNDEMWDFNIGYLTEDSILLEPTAKSDSKLTLQLKPFPEL